MSASSHSKSNAIEKESINDNRSQKYVNKNSRMETNISQRLSVTYFGTASDKNVQYFREFLTEFIKMIWLSDSIFPGRMNTDWSIRVLGLFKEEQINLKERVDYRREEAIRAANLLRAEVEKGKKLEQELKDQQVENACIRFDTERESELLDWFKSSTRLHWFKILFFFIPLSLFSFNKRLS